MNYYLKYPILLLFSFLTLTNNSYTQEITDVSFEMIGDQIHIHYNLKAPAKEEYNISASLKRLNDGSFNYVPENLSGEIGEGIYPGTDKTIIWKYSEDELAMFDGDDFYFEVFAHKLESSGGIPWYYFVGTAAVGGAVAAVVLLGGSETSKNNTPVTTFPVPPGRP